MKVKEILELTLHDNLSSIAKNRLEISEKPLRAALKAAQCEPMGKGKKGWRFTGEDGVILDKSIYECTGKSPIKAQMQAPKIASASESMGEQANANAIESEGKQMHAIENVAVHAEVSAAKSVD